MRTPERVARAEDVHGDAGETTPVMPSSSKSSPIASTPGDDGDERSPTTVEATARAMDGLCLRDATNAGARLGRPSFKRCDDARADETGARLAARANRASARFHSPTDATLSPASKFVARKAHHAAPMSIADKLRAASAGETARDGARSRFAPGG